VADQATRLAVNSQPLLLPRLALASLPLLSNTTTVAQPILAVQPQVPAKPRRKLAHCKPRLQDSLQLHTPPVENCRGVSTLLPKLNLEEALPPWRASLPLAAPSRLLREGERAIHAKRDSGKLAAAGWRAGRGSLPGNATRGAQPEVAVLPRLLQRGLAGWEPGLCKNQRVSPEIRLTEARE
jgi:hypothetical protein